MTPRRRAARAAVLVAAVAVLLGMLGTGAASAHPLGSFTVNTASVLRVASDTVRVDLVVDFAEVPAAQVRPDVAAAGADSWRQAVCSRAASQATLTVDGRVRPLVSTAGGSLAFPAGDGGLSTMRLVCRYAAETGGQPGTVEYALTAYADRVGWRETVAVGDGTTLVSSDVPERSPSELLTQYPDDPRGGGSDVTSARLTVRPGGPAAPDPLATEPAAAGGLTEWMSGLIGRDTLTLGVGLLALAVAVVLGTAHAFAPGHGKTVMAARIVGGSATGRQLAATAGAVTLTHTLGVLVLAVVLSTSSGFAPEEVYPWLGLVSGVLMVGLGASLLRTRLALKRHHDHRHDHDHEHENDGHGHDGHHHHGGGHAHGGHAHGGRWHVHPSTAEPPRLRSLLAAGLVGGMVPTPSAVVVLLGAVALGRAWFGVLLVVAYGVGMAATLVGVGLLLDRALLPLLRRVQAVTPGLAVGVRWVPVASAAVVVLVGAVVALHAGGQVAV